MPAVRPRGPSVRLKLTLSYAGFLTIAVATLLTTIWLVGLNQDAAAFFRRLVPDGALSAGGRWVPGNTNFLLRGFAPAALVLLVLLLAFGLIGGWFLSGRMLAPLTRITDATRRASDGSLDHRIRLDGRRDEFRELADAFDTMLARLEAHVAEHQRFAANASHELRTPLAVTQTLLDVALADPERDTEALLERLHVVNTRAVELTEALLLLSRTDQRAFTPAEVDLSLVAEEAVETLLPLAEAQGVTLTADGQVATVLGSQPLLLQMATNLVHNAIVHNHRAGAVGVTTAGGTTTTTLTVENDGDLVDPALVATLTEPFQRGTSRVHGGHAGVGLGLAIVTSIVAAHDGTLTLTPRPSGGLTVVVSLPRR